MARPALLRTVLLLCPLFIASGCPLPDGSGEEPRELHLSIAAGRPLVTLAEPASLTVRAENRGARRIVWGLGSSSCQLGAVVLVDGERHSVAGMRACTADYGEQGLEAGGIREETWSWDGRILADGGLRPLPDGEYPVYGTAGDFLSREVVLVRVNRR